MIFNKLFGKKVEATIENIVRQEAEASKPVKNDIEQALEDAKNQALGKVVRNLVQEALLKQYAHDSYTHSKKAIELYANCLRETDKCPDKVFNEVHKMYPKACARISHKGAPTNYEFIVPELHLNDIIDALSDKIIAEIAEMD